MKVKRTKSIPLKAGAIPPKANERKNGMNARLGVGESLASEGTTLAKTERRID
ncbi:hypothetical protein SLEP1_g58799 [Rubroshorea leprosula]|uniref:Uncharacterized protein n=1 Tax=Rubroshorea leprosula TaxID=152421 RepID=A0AAV5MQL7_9ROSI|nr:hypothetical protein SLEP1_g58799 [Rubroshorea leprosula]